MISARIETAISAGLTAPMSRPIGRVDALDRRLAEARGLQPLDAARMRLPRAERADVEALGLERGVERRIVDLRIVGQRQQGGVAVEPERGSASSGHSAQTGTSGKRSGVAKAVRGSTIVMSKPESLRHRRERLADVHRAGDDDCDGRHLHGEEDLAPAGLDHAALARAEPLVEQVGQRVGGSLGFAHEALLARRDVGDEDRRAPRGALGVELGEEVEAHHASSMGRGRVGRADRVRGALPPGRP